MCHFFSLDSDFKSSISKILASIIEDFKLLVKFLYNVPENLKLYVEKVHDLFAHWTWANNLWLFFKSKAT